MSTPSSPGVPNFGDHDAFVLELGAVSSDRMAGLATLREVRERHGITIREGVSPRTSQPVGDESSGRLAEVCMFAIHEMRSRIG